PGAAVEDAVEERDRLLHVAERRAQPERRPRRLQRLRREPRVVECQAGSGEREQRRPVDAATLRRAHPAARLEPLHPRHPRIGRLRNAGWHAGVASGEQSIPERVDAEAERAQHADAGDENVAGPAPRPRTSVTLWPPNPYDEVSATSSGCRRPAVGTRSRSLHAGSGSRSVAVAGSSEPSSASTVT